MWDYKVGHVIDVLRTLEAESVQMVVTSPPYWGLRSYLDKQDVVWGGDDRCEHEWGDMLPCHHPGQVPQTKWQEPEAVADGQTHGSGSFCQKCGAWRGAYGLEPTPEMYVEHTVLILREIKRVLRKDGVVFWNIADCYAGSGGPGGDFKPGAGKDGADTYGRQYHREGSGLKPKDLVMIPFRVALATQADGWWVRSDIVWSKPNPMPESCTDRPTKSHEYIFLFTKSANYFWDQEAVREQSTGNKWGKSSGCGRGDGPSHSGKPTEWTKERLVESGRNLRSVWTTATHPYSEAHFATFPEEIPRKCILAGTSAKGNCPACGAPWIRVLQREKTKRTERLDNPNIGGLMRCPQEIDRVKTIGWEPTCECGKEPIPALVLDPFCGSGTTLWVARKLGRNAIGIDIANNYKELAEERAMLKVPDIETWGDADTRNQ